ncbi:two-component sensor histidine kinase/PAS domain-containing protein [Streptomyces sp. TE33382]
MPSMNDLVRQHTALSDTDLEWLHLLVSEWQLLSDLSFADLVLWVPTRDGTRYVSVAQMRPNTGPTSYQDDMVGHLVPRGRRPLLDAALDEGRIVREGDPEWREEVPVRVESIPVRREGRVLGVIARNTNLLTVRTPSRLELTYLQSASDLAQMIAAGAFPFPGQQVDMDASPRVGDGLIRLDADGVVQYASPNGLSAYHRLGLASDLVGHHLGTTTAELAPSRGPVDEALVKVASGYAPREFEVECAGGVIQLRAIPLKPKGVRIGSLVLLRDVTELRRRERELITKDATIREIHHRVKNNLQTVAALLRLQARRMDSEQGREALNEAVRRVGSIAIVHETLSQNLDERVEFDEIADRVIAMVAEISPGKVTCRRTGRFGILDAEVATPLSMVLTEVLQNALEHAFAVAERGTVEVSAVRGGSPTEGRLLITVTDDGRGPARGVRPAAGRESGTPDRTDPGGGRVGRNLRDGSGARARHPGGAGPSGPQREVGGRGSGSRGDGPAARRRHSTAGPDRGNGPGPLCSAHVAMRFGGTARCDSKAGLCVRSVRAAGLGLVAGGRSGAGVTRPVASGAALHRAALVLAEATPDAGVLAGLKRPLQALLHDGAATADGLGFLDLQQRRTGVADGEEQLGVFLTTNGVVTPVHGCYLSLVLHAGACECERFHESPRR